MITVFTPAYNRAYIITNLYDSLCRQSYKDFEWVVIDDGSTDNTSDLVESFISQNRINIRYYRVENGGKHRAINRGVKLANGELFFIVDSDDYLTDDALEKLNNNYQNICGDESFAGVCGLRKYPNGQINGLKKEFNIIDSSPQHIAKWLSQDKAEAFRTEILKKYPFPEYDGERFISEGVVWNRIGRKYKLRYFFEPIYICDYLVDGLTLSISKLHRNSPCGTMLLYAESMRYSPSLIHKIKSAINYWRYANIILHRNHKELRPAIWSYLILPFGFIIRILDN